MKPNLSDMKAGYFEKLFGIRERDYAEVQQRLRVEGDRLVSAVNGAAYACGRLEIPSLGELREQVAASALPPRPSTCREIVADAQSLHADPANAGALFQVAFYACKVYCNKFAPLDGQIVQT